MRFSPNDTQHFTQFYVHCLMVVLSQPVLYPSDVRSFSRPWFHGRLTEERVGLGVGVGVCVFDLRCRTGIRFVFLSLPLSGFYLQGRFRRGHTLKTITVLSNGFYISETCYVSIINSQELQSSDCG